MALVLATGLAGRPPSAGALIREPVQRTIETACFLRYSLLTATDRLLMMVRRRVETCGDKRRRGPRRRWGIGQPCTEPLAGALSTIVAATVHLGDRDPRATPITIAVHRDRRPATRAQLVRERLMEGVRPVALVVDRAGAAPVAIEGGASGTRSAKWLRRSLLARTNSAVFPPMFASL